MALDKRILNSRAVHGHSSAWLPKLHGAEVPMVTLTLSPVHPNTGSTRNVGGSVPGPVVALTLLVQF